MKKVTYINEHKERPFLNIKIPKKTLYCSHKHLNIYADKRQLECDDCKELIDPFEFAYNKATYGQRYYDECKQLMLKRDALQVEVKKLEYQLSRLKTNLRQAARD
ncbi:hypothetical protein [Zooshikella sp. RANM57]|uniref:hypothetical protein n=1 Tax=Zooshikella sp. RANM57 TaxID=3425863 RepID=UPI003D6EE891